MSNSPAHTNDINQVEPKFVIKVAMVEGENE